jgi:SpoVK/Ycf46/Vps4 family AAA+-type ATPase
MPATRSNRRTEALSRDDATQFEDVRGLGLDGLLVFDGVEVPSSSSFGRMEALKEKIRMKILYPLQHAEPFKAYDKKNGGGVVLYGPPPSHATPLSRAACVKRLTSSSNTQRSPSGPHRSCRR